MSDDEDYGGGYDGGYSGDEGGYGSGSAAGGLSGSGDEDDVVASSALSGGFEDDEDDRQSYSSSIVIDGNADANRPRASSEMSGMNLNFFVTHPLEDLDRSSLAQDGVIAPLPPDPNAPLVVEDDDDPENIETNPPQKLARTIFDVIDMIRRARPHHNAIAAKKDAKNWRVLTWEEYTEDIYQAARGFLRLGVSGGSAVCIYGSNSIEWACSYFGAMVVTGLAMGVYSTTSPEALYYMTQSCKVRVLVMESSRMLIKMADVVNAIKELEAVILWGDRPDAKLRDSVRVPIMTWQRFMELGLVEKRKLDRLLKMRREGITPASCASICFTPGRTGPPKPVMLSHDNLCWTAGVVLGQIGMTTSDKHVSHLPLAHPAMQILDLVGAMIVGYCTWFGPIDRTFGTLGSTLREIQPSIFVGTPRLYELLRYRIARVIKYQDNVKQQSFNWALSQGTAKNESNQFGGRLPLCWCVADHVVFSEIREKLGFIGTRLHLCFSYFIDDSVQEFFSGIDMPLFQFYGTCETTGFSTMSLPIPKWWRIGTVGKSLPYTRARRDQLIGDDDHFEGEPKLAMLEFQGRNVFMGYLNDRALSRDAFNSEGYFISGDLGWVEREKKHEDNEKFRPLVAVSACSYEMYRNEADDLVIPAYLEYQLRLRLGGAINYAIIIGYERPFMVTLLTLKAELKMRSMEPTDFLHDQVLDVFEEVGIIEPQVAFSDETDTGTTSSFASNSRRRSVVDSSGGFASTGVTGATSMDEIESMMEEEEEAIRRVSQAVMSHRVHEFIQRGIDKFNRAIDDGEMADWVNENHKIANWYLMERDFGPLTEEVDALLRPRREFIEERYAHIIESLYTGEPFSLESAEAEAHRRGRSKSFVIPASQQPNHLSTATYSRLSHDDDFDYAEADGGFISSEKGSGEVSAVNSYEVEEDGSEVGSVASIDAPIDAYSIESVSG